MKKVLYMITAALLLTVAGAQAQGSDELAALQKQLAELSAKIAQMEQANSERLTKLESDNAAKIAKLEAADAKNKIPDWVNDTKFKGDFRYRYENVQSDSDTSQDRQRVRLRVGAYGKVNDFVDYGVRLATGSSSDGTSANQTVDGISKKGVWLDRYYADIHPEMFHGAHLIMGKMEQPWMNRTGLVWDDDISPEGLAVTYATSNTNGIKLLANAGSFVLKEDGVDDMRLWAGQLAGESKVGDATVRLGVSDFYYDNSGSQALANGANAAGTQFNLMEGFGSVGTKIANLPVTFNGQYVVNTAASAGDDTAYLLGFSVGKAKDKGTWEAGYNYRDTGANAVPDAYNDSDFANGTAGSHGHAFWAKYQIAKNLQAKGTYLMAVDNTGKDINTFQADLNFSF